MASAVVPPPSSHPPSTRPATRLVSCEEMLLGVEGDSEVLNQVDLQLNEKNLVDEEVRAIEVRKIDEDGGLLDSSTIATFEFDGGLAMTYETRLGADAFSLMYPSIKTELCDSKESILETGVKEAMDRGMPRENMGSRESGDDVPEGQQVSSFVEIYPLRSHDISEVKEEVALLDDVEEDDSTDEVKKVVVSLNDVQVPSKNVVGNCWGNKGDGAYTGLNVGDVPSIVHRSTSLDIDGRFIPPRNDTSYLSILGSARGIRSAVRYVFDPGGDASPKLLLSTLVFGSWFPP